jgi:zinc/manganese transport system permease protein
MIEALDPGILGPALLAGLLVLATHVPLGQEVLKRGIIFADLAIAQIAGLGVIAAASFGWEAQGVAVQAVAFLAALAGAGLLYLAEHRFGEVQEALIGALFVLAATGGILLLASNPHAGEHLRDLLVGQILWVEPRQLVGTCIVSAVVLALWFGLPAMRGQYGFYLVFALAVTAAVQLVGIYLVFASLILPALATRRLTGARKLWIGYVVGITGYALGIILSALFDLATGAVIVWTLAAVTIAAAWTTACHRPVS